MKKYFAQIALACMFFAPAIALESRVDKEKPQNTYTVKLTEKELGDVWNVIEGTQRELDNSTMPHDKVKVLVGSLEGVKKLIADQINPQIKAALDSTKKK